VDVCRLRSDRLCLRLYRLKCPALATRKKLAAQFYFSDLTVLKVMFTAIVVAMVLLFGAVGLGILDLARYGSTPPIWPLALSAV
jgi:hypothetical protein